MECCYRIEPAIPAERLEALCTLRALPALCADVYELTGEPVGDGDVERGEVSCVWGVFDTRVSRVRNGVRYELLSCPNALQWTVTTRGGVTTLHGSINQMEPDPDFAETIRLFLERFRDGLLAQSR